MILAVSHTLCSFELLPGEKETTLSAIATVQFCACGDLQTSLLVCLSILFFPGTYERLCVYVVVCLFWFDPINFSSEAYETGTFFFRHSRIYLSILVCAVKFLFLNKRSKEWNL